MFAMLFGVHQLFFIWACFTFEIMKLPVLQYTNMHEITFNVYEVRTHVFQHRLEFFPKCTLPTVIIYEHTQRVVALEIPCIRLNWCEHWQIASDCRQFEDIAWERYQTQGLCWWAMINPKETFEEERQRRTIVLPFHILYQDTYLCCYINLYCFVHHQLISFIFFSNRFSITDWIFSPWKDFESSLWILPRSRCWTMERTTRDMRYQVQRK